MMPRRCTKDSRCRCKGTGEIEDGPSGATYSIPCPGVTICPCCDRVVPDVLEPRIVDRLYKMEVQKRIEQGDKELDKAQQESEDRWLIDNA